jgi:integrase
MLRKRHRADMLEFIEYCGQLMANALPADHLTISDFLMSTSITGIKNSTVRRKAASISAVHRLLNYVDPIKHPEVRITLRNVSRQLGNRFEQAYPITRDLLEKLLNVCKEDMRGIRNRVLLLLAYDSMRRRSELISLRIEDINWLSNETCCILLRRRKTNQQATGK